MDFKDLEYLVAVAEAESLTHAAERLIVTQPTLSKTLARLEEAAGCQLFVRTQHGLEQTEEGGRFVETARKLLRMKEDLDAEMRGAATGAAGRIRLGISHTFSRILVPKVLPVFTRDHPGVEVAIHTETSSLLQRLLLDGDIDVAVMVGTDRNKALAYEVLFHEQIVLAVATGNPLAERGESREDEDFPYIEPGLLAGQRFILSQEKMRLRESADTFFRRENLVPDIAVTTASTTTAIHLASQGVGVAFIPVSIAMEYVEPPVPRYFVTSDSLENWEVAIAIQRKNRRSPLLGAFLKCFKEAM